MDKVEHTTFLTTKKRESVDSVVESALSGQQNGKGRKMVVPPGLGDDKKMAFGAKLAFRQWTAVSHEAHFSCTLF
jgi:hypothetical protein